MPGIIQRIPQGLQGFLELKGEQLPSPLSEQLLAQLDLRKWYLETNSEIVVTPQVALATGNQTYTDFTVPNTEWWHLSAVMAEVTGYGAGENIVGLTICSLIAPAGVQVPHTQPRSMTGSATIGSTAFGAVVDLFLPPGSQALTTNLQDQTGAGLILPQIRITRLPF